MHTARDNPGRLCDPDYRDWMLDEALFDSFPASDPPAIVAPQPARRRR